MITNIITAETLDLSPRQVPNHYRVYSIEKPWNLGRLAAISLPANEWMARFYSNSLYRYSMCYIDESIMTSPIGGWRITLDLISLKVSIFQIIPHVEGTNIVGLWLVRKSRGTVSSTGTLKNFSSRTVLAQPCPS
ncbi:uncharacterized protein H6S33_005244 [Morchella sextelata]|uniref:uncharacterized protein n=1 Tax=Morchella sextelata TaxID=1174677 RepID=UPI001D039A1C|nr:uncharacterized protein H6S33_005244 [Morchella sextelata]KAH0605262.1 hypothetical protein H6S33_005244 [Morchella sextelata]